MGRHHDLIYLLSSGVVLLLLGFVFSLLPYWMGAAANTFAALAVVGGLCTMFGFAFLFLMCALLITSANTPAIHSVVSAAALPVASGPVPPMLIPPASIPPMQIVITEPPPPPPPPPPPATEMVLTAELGPASTRSTTTTTTTEPRTTMINPLALHPSSTELSVTRIHTTRAITYRLQGAEHALHHASDRRAYSSRNASPRHSTTTNRTRRPALPVRTATLPARFNIPRVPIERAIIVSSGRRGSVPPAAPVPSITHSHSIPLSN